MSDDSELARPGWRKRIASETRIVNWTAAEDGFSLSQAITRFSKDRILAAMYSGIRFEEQITHDQLVDYIDAEYLLLKELVGDLRAGKLLSRAFKSGEMSAIEVPPQWWNEVTINLDENSARAHGTILTGIIIRAPSPATEGKSPERKKLSQPEINQWMLERAIFEMNTRGVILKQPFAVRECMEATMASSRAALRAHGKLPENLRRSRGSPGKGKSSS